VTEVLFWICAIGAIYSYALYPALLIVLPRRGARPGIGEGQALPAVTLVVACRNEAGRLRHKLDNALAVHYPGLEVLVASDASDDGSDDIVREYADRGIRLVRSPERLGKEHAQGLAIQAARGEIVVFSDAGTDLPPDSIRHIVSDFEDPRVGAVSSEDTFVSADGSVVGEGAYVRYEMWLRRLEASVHSLVGLSGSFFAARRSVLQRWDDSIPSDFATAINTVRMGLVAISDPRVRGIYRDVKDPSTEYARKVRTALRGMAALAHIPEVLNPFRYGVFALQILSHKVMRWLVPWFLLGVLLSNVLLAQQSTFFRVLLWLQLAGYALVTCAHFSTALRGIGLVRIAYYFVQVNVALAQAGLRFLQGDRVRVWNPTVR
jgi:cellulose synthase/poly-beta-1,6-N-acetylglucosamine synthase-like glycosyltransferase